MNQSFSLRDTQVIMFDGQEVENLELNGELIWFAMKEFIDESEASQGLVFTGLDASGKMETEEGFDGTVVGYMLGDNSTSYCNGLDLNVFDLNSSKIVIPSKYNGLPVLKLGQFCLAPISVDGYFIVNGLGFENGSVAMPNLREIKLGVNIKEVDTLRTIVCVDYNLSCKMNIPSSMGNPSYPAYDGFTFNTHTIYDNREKAVYEYVSGEDSGSIACKKLIISKNTEVVGMLSDGEESNAVYAGFEEVEFEARTKPIELSEFCFKSQMNLVNINLPNQLSSLPLQCFRDCNSLPQINIPSSVSSIGRLCFYQCSQLTSARFEHSINDIITLPAAGEMNGMFYVKEAKEMTIYTDNETIKNYDYLADGVTATILHLDGSLWE